MKREDILILAAALAARHNRIESAEWVMRKFGILTFGIERVECADRSTCYVNTGDTYDSTVLRGDDGEFVCGSWGGWYESAEAEHCTDENVIRCAYCSAFTDLTHSGEQWRETVCSSCGHFVDGSGKPAATAAE